MLKRGFDIALSAFGLILSSPLWLLFAVLIKLDDHGPVFYLAERVGRNGKTFRAFKFRSMKVGADKTVQAAEDDPRVTRMGKFLRATAMDELPQLLNIFLGDMSFVGPRALLPSEVEIHGSDQHDEVVEDLFRRRCAVTPGLTGVAQIFAPRDVPRRKKFRYDLFYIRKQNFWFDLKLIFLSFWITFRGRWETREDKLGQTKSHV